MNRPLLLFVLSTLSCWRVVAAFVVPHTKRGCHQWCGCGDDVKPFAVLQSSTVPIKDNETTSTKPGNQKVRKIMNVLTSRYDDNSKEASRNGVSPDWAKARNYIYHANGNLSPCQVEEVIAFLDSFFPQETVRCILQSSPRILRKSVKGSLQPTAEFLRQLYGLDLFLEAISRNPSLLLTSGVGCGENKDLEAFLVKDLGLSASAVSRLKKTSLFHLKVEKVQEVVTFLDNILQSGRFSMNQSHGLIGKILGSHTYLMNLSVDANLKPRISFLVERCELRKRDVATLVKSSPGVLGLSVESNLKPTLDYLSMILSQDTAVKNNKDKQKQVLRKCLMGHPQLLALSMKNLETKVSYFNEIDGLVPRLHGRQTASLAARIAARSPAVFSLSLKENIVPTVEFLAKIWGASCPQVHWEDGEMVLPGTANQKGESDSLAKSLKEYPSVLTLSLEGNIQPTISFFNRTGYIYLDEEWREASGHQERRSHRIPGRYIAASLFSRLLPRWHHVVSKERDESQETEFTSPPLHVLVGSTDAAFCEQMGFDLNEYIAFKTENAPRLKFSSQFDTWLKTGRPIDVN